MKTPFKSIIILALAAGLFASCKKTGETGTVSIRMTDAPAAYDAVNVEVTSVELQVAGQGWTTLNTNAGVYDLLQLQNGVDTLLATGVSLPVGRVNQMRLILGSNNTIVQSGVSFPLLLSSQDETGLKLNLNYDFQAGVNYEIKFDFVADQSVVTGGNGTFRLKPVLKVVHINVV